MRTTLRAHLSGAAALVAIAALAACGSHSSASAPPTSSATSSQQRYVAALTHFAGCMRSHGIPVPDPSSQGEIAGSQALQQQYQNTPQGQAALNACQSYLQRAVTELTPANTQQYRHAQLLFARCMRAHGVQLPDPGPNGDIPINQANVNKASPQFQSAAQACAYLRQSGHQVAIGR